MTTDLAERVAQLENAEASRRLSYQYGRALDDVDLETLTGLFSEDAVLDIPGDHFEGRDAILGFFAEAFAAAKVSKRHFMCNLDVTSTGADTTHMTSRFIYTFAGDDTSIIGWGNYVDDVRVTGGRAVFTYKRIEIDMHADSRVGWATA